MTCPGVTLVEVYPTPSLRAHYPPPDCGPKGPWSYQHARAGGKVARGLEGTRPNRACGLVGMKIGARHCSPARGASEYIIHTPTYLSPRKKSLAKNWGGWGQNAKMVQVWGLTYPIKLKLQPTLWGSLWGVGGCLHVWALFLQKSMWLPSNTAGNKETEPSGPHAAIPGYVGRLSWKGHGHKRATLAHQLGDVWVWPVLVVPAASTTTTIASTATGASTSATLTSPNRT